MSTTLILIFGLLIVAGTFASKISNKFGLPVLLVFLLIGMLAGTDGLNLIQLDDYAMTRDVANIALLFILFDSGFNTKKDSLKKYAGPSITLATLGVAVTAVALGLLLHLLLKLELLYSLLIGAIISSTDAAAVMNIMRERPVKEHVSSTLEIESAANDPMAILLTTFMVNMVLQGGIPAPAEFGVLVVQLLWQFGGGILVAAVLSRVAIWLFNRFRCANQSMYYVLYVGTLLSIFGVADLIKANGTIAVFFAGFWMGNSNFVFKRGLSHFISGISTFANMVVFLLLGLLVVPKSMVSVWGSGLILAAVLIFVARPLTVWLCTSFFKFSTKDRLFISWGGLKGAVPIILATYPAAAGLDGDGMIFNIVFFVVALSCLLQGGTLSFLAKKLGLSIPPQIHSPYSLELFALDHTDIDVVDTLIHQESPLVGKRLMDLQLPHSMVISSIVRHGKLVSPRGATVLENNDIVFFMGNRWEVEQVILSGGAEILVEGAACMLPVEHEQEPVDWSQEKL